MQPPFEHQNLKAFLIFWRRSGTKRSYINLINSLNWLLLMSACLTSTDLNPAKAPKGVLFCVFTNRRVVIVFPPLSVKLNTPITPVGVPERRRSFCGDRRFSLSPSHLSRGCNFIGSCIKPLAYKYGLTKYFDKVMTAQICAIN